MSDEEKTPVEETGDDALSAAYDALKEEAKPEAQEEKKVDTQKVDEAQEQLNLDTEQPSTEKQEATTEQVKEEKAPETVDHKESSKLGRKFAGLESKFDLILKRLDQINATPKETPIETPEIIATPQDLDQALAAREQRARIESQEYERGYLLQVKDLAGINKDLHDEIFDEMMANFNVRHSANPTVDAKINYSEAKAAVLQKKYQGKAQVPNREKSAIPPMQPAGSASRTATKAEIAPKFDQAAAEYAAHLKKTHNYTDEQIAKMLA